MIRYFSEDICFDLKDKMRHRRWLSDVASRENRRLGALNYIFCPDSYLLDINRRYLGHDYYTDIITFDYCEDDVLSGDLFISIDTVRANAGDYGVSFYEELDRVMVHGILHLIGYNDHSDEEILQMREKEDFYLGIREAC